MTIKLECDLLVVGSGAAGLTCAIAAKKRGLNVVVIEKEPVFGGTTALSGGVLWVPLTHHGRKQNPQDNLDAVRAYMKHEIGVHYDEAAVEAFLENGPKLIDFLESETEMKFIPTLYPDYHPDAPGGALIGRSILAQPYDIRGLGKDMARLKLPLKSITFIGMMFNSSNTDLKHFFQVTKSLTSFIYVVKRLLNHIRELALYRRAIYVTSGNALAARLAKSALDMGIPIMTSSPAKQVLIEGGRVVGMLTAGQAGDRQIRARFGVVLACGGFSQEVQRIAKAYPHLRSGGEHLSPTPESNTGDGVCMAEMVGADVDLRFKDAAAWMPVSKVPFGNGEFGVFPHLLDRYKPGVIGVLRNGKRFTNESNSYHDVGMAMIEACKGQNETAMWLICDQNTMNKYGLGYAKPAPMLNGKLIKNGYLYKGKTLSDLARSAGINEKSFENSIREFNEGAINGVDAQYARGTTAFNRYLADANNQPNPCVAPIQKGPFYAVKLVMGDLGTFDGIQTTMSGEIKNRDGSVISGLYAVGNDRASIMGGNYPAAGITHGPNMVFGFVTANFIADKAGT